MYSVFPCAPYPAFVHPLFLNDIGLTVVHFLNLSDLARFALVSVKTYKMSELGFLARAKLYGYTGDQTLQAKQYLKDLWLVIKTSLESQMISTLPEKEIKRIIQVVSSEFQKEAKQKLEMKLTECLLQALNKNDLKQTKKFLLLGADPNVRNESHTLLQWIISLNRAFDYKEIKEILDLLLSHGKLNINQQNKYGTTALHLAVLWEDCHLTCRLLDAGADPLQPNFSNITPLGYSAKSQMIRDLLASYLDKRK